MDKPLEVFDEVRLRLRPEEFRRQRGSVKLSPVSLRATSTSQGSQSRNSSCTQSVQRQVNPHRCQQLRNRCGGFSVNIPKLVPVERRVPCASQRTLTTSPASARSSSHPRRRFRSSPYPAPVPHGFSTSGLQGLDPPRFGSRSAGVVRLRRSCHLSSREILCNQKLRCIMQTMSP